MQRKYAAQAANRREDGSSRTLTVGLPMPGEGVGNALRRTFRPLVSDLPGEMADLLAKLDRF